MKESQTWTQCPQVYAESGCVLYCVKAKGHEGSCVDNAGDWKGRPVTPPPAQEGAVEEALAWAAQASNWQKMAHYSEPGAMEARLVSVLASEVLSLRSKLESVEKAIFDATEAEAAKWNIEIIKVFERAEAAEQALSTEKARVSEALGQLIAARSELAQVRAENAAMLDANAQLVLGNAHAEGKPK
jgi:hypothetical protein